MPTIAWILLACLAGGVLSLGIAALVAYRVQARSIPTLVSFAVGALLGAVFLDIIPHLFANNANPKHTAGLLLAGILVFFVLEKLLLWRHHHHDHGAAALLADDDAGLGHGHGHAHAHAHEQEEHDHGRSGWMIIAGDSFHNFTDGVIIATAFLADTRLGIVTAAAIVAHEIPQEIGDFLILLNSGFSKTKAMLLNIASSLATFAGALLGYFAFASASQWVPTLLAIAASSMIYVAVADLIPGLQKRASVVESFTQILFIGLGIGCIAAIHTAMGH